MADGDLKGRRITDYVHAYVRQVVQPGECTIDATTGNGHDTLFLANCVGPSGSVLGVDIQDAAVIATRARLRAHGVLDRVALHTGCHSLLLPAWSAKGTLAAGSVAAVLFNLGWLPGSDKQIITRGATTVQALDAACALLRVGGVLAVTAYRGHAGGSNEADRVLAFMEALPPKQFDTEAYKGLTPTPTSPVALFARRRA